MKRLATSLLAVALLVTAFAGAARAAEAGYGIEAFGLSYSEQQAGAHADFTTSFAINTDKTTHRPFGSTARVEFHLPPGIAGEVAAFPQCSAAELTAAISFQAVPKDAEICPIDSQVGVTEITIISQGGGTSLVVLNEPVYNMTPGPGEAARFGFVAQILPVLVDVRLDPASDYGLTATLESLSASALVTSAKTTFWGDPTSPIHDADRITPYEAFECDGTPCTAPGKEARHSSLLPRPFISTPTSCGDPGTATALVASYEDFEHPVTRTAPMPQLGGCGLLDFKPQLSLKPTTSTAESGTGLDVELNFPQEGLEHPNLLAESHLKKAEVTLPEGVTVNPSAAEGLGVCSQADLARETATSAPNEGCPESSKIGTVIAKSPLLDEAAEGGLFLAKPNENPFGSLLALYMVLKIPERGVIVKLAGKVSPDPKTGQLITSFEDLPQLPISYFRLHFREGARAPLVTPPRCGSYQTVSHFTPWSAPEEVITTTSSFEVTRGVNGGPCPNGTPPFQPGFEAGSLNNNAGSYSPFYMRLTRRDGDQDLTKFSATLPPGMVAKLAGTSECPEGAIAQAKTKSGKEELASPSCPASSEIGHTLAGAGVGSVLTYVPGKVYLAGPYRGAPLSVVAITPAVAGPFDVGTVLTRVALQIDPLTAEVHVDGAHSDPIPHILVGIPLKVRDIRVYVDKPSFTLNPTSCDPSQVGAQLWGGGNDIFSALDDSPVSLAARFQAAACASLGFKPKLDLKLSGGTKRGGHPALAGTYTPRPGDANLAGLIVRFPHSAFLDQAHIRTICTRVQFAAKQCPEGAVYGHAKAITPLLDQPLEGPVYLRSSNHNLPDFVADLHGLIDVEAVARIDSSHGGIRATFAQVPDAPLTKVVVQMQGGKKGLIVNSTDLCRGSHRTDVQLSAHNGAQLELHPQMRADCGKQRKHKRHHATKH